MEIKECKDCRWEFEKEACFHPTVRQPGYPKGLSRARSEGQPCGPEGKLFEPKRGSIITQNDTDEMLDERRKREAEGE